MLRTIFLVILIAQSTIQAQTQTSLECVKREFNVVVHNINKRNKTPIETISNILKAIDSINAAFAPVCMKFNLCNVRTVKNFNFLQWHKNTMEGEFLALYYEPRTINIIIVEDLIIPTGFDGYATLGGISLRSKPYIVVRAKTGTITWVHELGHYFGLEHTFEPPIGLADNSDCAIAGDNICDTPADPFGPYDGINCIYTGNIKDATGKYYNPLLENFMSYYGKCRKSFTHQQYLKMISTYKIDPEAHF